MMIQTEPQIYESELVYEPNPLEPKPVHLAASIIIPAPDKEPLYEMHLPAPEIEINRDWSESKLFKHL